MTIFQLKEVINSKYNRNDTDRYHRSVLFLIENTVTGLFQLFQIDRISKTTAALRCNTRQCGHRLSLEHALATEPSGKNLTPLNPVNENVSSSSFFGEIGVLISAVY